MNILLLLSSCYLHLLSITSAVSISSSCNGKNDGLHYIKPTEQGNIIPVICNDGYTMLDVSLNFAEISSYFTTLYRYGDDDKAMWGTDCSDSVGWRDWFIPANQNTKFRVAKDCQQCQGGNIFGDQTAYYMTSGYFCPVDVDSKGCVVHNPSLYEDVFCNICDDDEGLCGASAGRDGEETGKWCDCYTLQLSPDHLTNSHHEHYCQDGLGWRPNLVVDRTQCTCYKPDESEDRVYDDIEMDDLPLVSTNFKDEILESGLYIDELIQWDYSESDDDPSICAKRTRYLSNEDFEDGTLRIVNCGNYILTEDIVVNFNKPSQAFNYEAGDSPNAYNLDNLHWFPTSEQQANGDYFGLDAFWGPFSIGFFAAIAIETSHVNIDLNGFSISMDPEFYLQQRFFAIIELGNKQFEARQGPVDFGREDLRINHVVIQNGILGLTSHHGIHGQFAGYIEINGLQIQDFDVGGIQCNGCHYMDIVNCDIGPQNIDIPVMGRYTHARAMLSRLRYLVDEYGDETVQFANRQSAPTVKQLADRFVEQMDMVYYHITQGIEFDETDKQWIAAKRTFINPTGWLDGASAYGILLNGQGTAVVNIGRRTDGTHHVKIQNVNIHDLKLKPHENFWASVSDDGSHKIIHGFFFETLDWNYGNIYDQDTGVYRGDAYTDLLFATNQFLRDEFCPLGSLFYLDGLTEWVFTDGKDLFDGDIDISFRCGSDIQSHSGKGAIGIRIDGTKSYEIDTVQIRNLVNWGDLGSSMCGEYEKITFETGVDVDKDIQYGYSGDNVHGILTDYAHGSIKDVEIEHLKSWHGSTHGIAIYKGSIAKFAGKMKMDHLIAGEKLSKQDSEALILPNAPPFVCSIFIGPNSDSDVYPELTPNINTKDIGLSVVAGENIYGYDHCTEGQRVGDMIETQTPEILMLNTNKWNIITQDSVINYYNVQMMVIALIVTAFIVLVFCVKRILCSVVFSHYNDKTKAEKAMSSRYGALN